jgi:hypothetical protein
MASQRIIGTVQIRGSGIGAANVRVEAWDGDGFLSPDDRIGFDDTDVNGAFDILINDEWKEDDPDGQEIPDVYFRLYNGAVEIPYTISKNDADWNADKTLYSVLLRIDVLAPAPSNNLEDFKERLTSIDKNIGLFTQSVPPQFAAFDKRLTDIGDSLETITDLDKRLTGIGDNIETITAYSPTSFDNGSSRNGGYRSSDVENLVSDAFRQILGKRVNLDDTRGLEAAFERVFEKEDEEGRQVLRWKPPTYSVETELGAQLTGSQASLYHYIKTSADELKRRINTLRPLQVDADDDLTYASRTSFLAELEDLVGAMGVPSEPRAFRINGNFARLKSYLNNVKTAFGFDNPNNLQTIEDERAETDFLIAEEYLTAMNTAWLKFVPDPKKLGSRFVKLEHLLGVVSEGVDEVFDALDAISFDAAERQEVVITSKLGDISIQEYFDWVLYFSTEKAPNILRDGGKSSLGNLKTEADELFQLSQEFYNSASKPLNHPRVNRAIGELMLYLQNVVKALS